MTEKSREPISRPNPNQLFHWVDENGKPHVVRVRGQRLQDSEACAELQDVNTHQWFITTITDTLTPMD